MINILFDWIIELQSLKIINRTFKLIVVMLYTYIIFIDDNIIILTIKE